MTRTVDGPHQGRIVQIEVDNFKSYRGRQIIGPFYDFTAVVGANGSGKSNLMDAISFVLGVKTAQLRGSLKELLYLNSEGKDEEDRPRRGYVKLVFQTSDGEEVHFTRAIIPSSASADASYQSQYKINDRNASWEAYNNKLKSYGILVQARNFLVFQGDIESVAALSPKDMTNLVEQISGSAAFKKEYDELEAKKAEADEKTSFVFSKKKAVMAEKKQKKEQKEEAEKHLWMQRDLEALKAEYYLWQLFQIEKDMVGVRQEAGKHKEELNGAAKVLYSCESKVEQKKKAAAGFSKERLLLERKHKKRKAELEKKSPDSAKVKEGLTRLQKRLKAEKKNVEDKEKKLQEQKQHITKLETDLKNITDAQEQLEEDMRTASNEGQVHLNAQHQAEFYKIQEEAKSKTSKLRSDHDSLQTAQDADVEALSNLEDTEKDVFSRVAQLDTDQASLKEKLAKTQAELATAKQELAAKKAAHTTMTDEHRRERAQRDVLTQKLEEGEAQLREAKADRKETERDRRMTTAVEQLKRLHPGVFGRVTELARVSQAKYNLAMSVVMGRDLDGVIVDTKETAQDCIQWLRTNQVAPMTFFPLDTPVNERLRLLGGTAKLALDLLEYDTSLERAFLTVCGNTLVCDSVDEARALAYSANERHKVVAADGTMISKNGFMTGGLTGNESARASRWNDSALDGLKQERDRAAEELEKLPSQRDMVQVEQQLGCEIAGLERDVQFKTGELKATEQRLKNAASEAKALREESHRKLPGATKLRKAIDDRARKMEGLQKRINEIEDRIFAAFSKKVGVDNIREYMEQNAAATEDFTKRRMALTSQATKLKHQLTYEQRRDLKADVAAAKAEVKKIQENLEKLEAEARTAAEAAESVEQELAAETARMEELRAQAEAAEAEVRAAKKEVARHQAEGNAARRALAAHEAALEALATKRSDLLEAAQMEQERAGTSGRFKLDFSGLKRQLTAARSEADRESLHSDFRREIDARVAALAHVAPNLKALEQFQAVKAREREQEVVLEAARKEAKAIAKAFNGVRQQRYDAFTAAFEHIASVIDSIFKDLTRSSVHPMGGTAYLSLESTDEPFLHGIKFTAMPPTKRFRDMEQLSGGEKTVAALALLFAIHSYQPSPFFVLDEIDAALDATNVARVADYIRAKTRPAAAARFQSIVISLKDNFYGKADALVGVARDVDHCCSATYTFDLTRFGAG
ncbi:RecF/RecN/SMC protein [Coccomyxa subellipsoidea C-169]|uniref:Structural maintenance of chromosomes protein n=1 Tax=Coccomyxa subellipsoidea (strain C-169) TaxID=574566 RepID=I0YR44_COCSC|nr:RecF/RecN/SMC protein [Coccomyxa subellipsoidea C-169]EIE20863.1 RecF/RecN/SMC protein [Coccomyxa subellipsoidea C-169]|eukprot:XP_005645407.1 RecF/RecN/SMC protein [Coccomyxa subellipsoidea C-169]